jgi:hypothetical protein
VGGLNFKLHDFRLGLNIAGGGGGEMDIDDIDEVEANNKIHLENFNLYDCESALSTPRTRGLLSSTL